MYFLTVAMSVHDSIQEDHLEIAIQSILKQTHRDFEFIIVLDGVKNLKISKLLNRFELLDNRIKLIHNNINRGLAYSMNCILKIMTSEWLVRMDADDYSFPTRLHEISLYIKNNDYAEIFGSYMGEFSDDFSRLNRIIKYPTDPINIKERFFVRNPIAHATATIKKSVLLEIGGYPIISIRDEDTLLWLSAMKLNVNFSNIDKSLYAARFDKSTKLRRIGLKKSFSDFIDRIRVILDLDAPIHYIFIGFLRFLVTISPIYSIVRFFIITR